MPMPPTTAARCMTTSGECWSYIFITSSSQVRSKSFEPSWIGCMLVSCNFLQTCFPRNPVPPVTTIFFILCCRKSYTYVRFSFCLFVAYLARRLRNRGCVDERKESERRGRGGYFSRFSRLTTFGVRLFPA